MRLEALAPREVSEQEGGGGGGAVSGSVLLTQLSHLVGDSFGDTGAHVYNGQHAGALHTHSGFAQPSSDGQVSSSPLHRWGN